MLHSNPYSHYLATSTLTIWAGTLAGQFGISGHLLTGTDKRISNLLMTNKSKQWPNHLSTCRNNERMSFTSVIFVTDLIFGFGLTWSSLSFIAELSAVVDNADSI